MYNVFGTKKAELGSAFEVFRTTNFECGCAFEVFRTINFVGGCAFEVLELNKLCTVPIRAIKEERGISIVGVGLLLKPFPVCSVIIMYCTFNSYV